MPDHDQKPLPAVSPDEPDTITIAKRQLRHARTQQDIASWYPGRERCYPYNSRYSSPLPTADIVPLKPRTDDGRG
jgi:hypothetical protein